MKWIKGMRGWLLVMVLVSVCLSQSGCALLGIPFKLLNIALEIAKRMPKPPPGVF